MKIKIDSNETSGPLVNKIITDKLKAPVFIGVCLNHKMNGKTFMGDMLGWILPRVTQCRIVLLDYLERFNIQAFNHCTLPEAEELVLKEGDRIYRRLQRLVAEKNGSNLVEIKRYKDLLYLPSFKNEINKIRRLYEENTDFKIDVKGEADEFASRIKLTKPQRYKNAYARDIDPINKYLIEEVGFYLALFHEGYTVEVFPGSDLSLLKNLGLGKYGDKFSRYNDRTHISIKAEE